MKAPSKAYLISLQLYARVCANGQLRKVTFEQYSEAGFDKIDTGQQARYIPENIVIMDADVLSKHELTPRAIKLFLSIIPELRMHNALWYYDHTANKADSAAIKQLRDVGILLRTEDTKIHFVNPDYLRKGSKPAVLALTTKELETVSRVTTDNIRPLGMKKVDVNLLDMHLSKTKIIPAVE